MAKQMKPGSQGLQSSKLVQVGQRLGKTATGYTPGGVAQIGSAVGSHATEGKRDTGYKGDQVTTSTPAGGNQRLGNECTEPCGPKGEGRTLYGQSGTNQQYGAATSSRPAPTGPDPLSPWFPPSPGRQSPVKK
jgi:hypothetical protein